MLRSHEIKFIKSGHIMSLIDSSFYTTELNSDTYLEVTTDGAITGKHYEAYDLFSINDVHYKIIRARIPNSEEYTDIVFQLKQLDVIEVMRIDNCSYIVHNTIDIGTIITSKDFITDNESHESDPIRLIKDDGTFSIAATMSVSTNEFTFGSYKYYIFDFSLNNVTRSIVYKYRQNLNNFNDVEIILHDTNKLIKIDWSISNKIIIVSEELFTSNNWYNVNCVFISTTNIIDQREMFSRQCIEIDTYKSIRSCTINDYMNIVVYRNTSSNVCNVVIDYDIAQYFSLITDINNSNKIYIVNHNILSNTQQYDSKVYIKAEDKFEDCRIYRSAWGSYTLPDNLKTLYSIYFSGNDISYYTILSKSSDTSSPIKNETTFIPNMYKLLIFKDGGTVTDVCYHANYSNTSNDISYSVGSFYQTSSTRITRIENCVNVVSNGVRFIITKIKRSIVSKHLFKSDYSGYIFYFDLQLSNDSLNKFMYVGDKLFSTDLCGFKYIVFGSSYNQLGIINSDGTYSSSNPYTLTSYKPLSGDTTILTGVYNGNRFMYLVNDSYTDNSFVKSYYYNASNYLFTTINGYPTLIWNTDGSYYHTAKNSFVWTTDIADNGLAFETFIKAICMSDANGTFTKYKTIASNTSDLRVFKNDSNFIYNGYTEYLYYGCRSAGSHKRLLATHNWYCIDGHVQVYATCFDSPVLVVDRYFPLFRGQYVTGADSCSDCSSWSCSNCTASCPYSRNNPCYRRIQKND